MIQRFLSGVHNKEDCGKNKIGYAAIGAAEKYADLHNTNNYFCGGGPAIVKHPRKRSVSSQDTIIYLIFRLIELFPSSSMYILLFSKETQAFNTLGSMISGISSKQKSISLIMPLNKGYSVTFYGNESESECFLESYSELRYFTKRVLSARQSIVLAYPLVSPECSQIINSMDGIRWCVPASISNIYIPLLEDESYSHFVFPWSKAGCCRGYTIGKGKLREGRKIDRQMYESKVNFYNDMISSVPIESSCSDCIAMERIGKLMQDMLPGQSVARPRPKSMPMIVALDNFNNMLKRHSGSF